MSITVDQWKDKLAVVEMFEKAYDTAQMGRNLSDQECANQMLICHKQIRRSREEMDRMVDRFTDEDREEASLWYDRHIVEDRPGLFLG